MRHLLLSGLIKDGNAPFFPPASCNVAPKMLVAIYEAFVRGDAAEAIAAQKRLSPVRIALMMGTAPGVVKQAMAIAGWDVGPSRSPIAPLSAEKRAKLNEILASAGLVDRVG